jgi:N-acetylmuramoyl-L-alanine amidase
MTYAWRFGNLPLLALSLLLSQSPLDAAWAEAAGTSLKKASRANCNRAQFKAVVDVGHTAEVPGATSARGVPEYEYNLRLAKRIGQKLTAAGFVKTEVLVTSGRTLKGLTERVGRANSMAPDLFLSIHHDSVPEYFLEAWEYAGAQQRFSDRFKGHSLFISYENSQAQASLYFARLLGDELKARGLQYASHYTQSFMGYKRRELLDAEAGVYRFDALIVLKNTQMPAVLLEAGSIVNRDEELAMGSPERQSIISAAVAEAVETFCSAQSPPLAQQLARNPRHGQVARPKVQPATAATPPANPTR